MELTRKEKKLAAGKAWREANKERAIASAKAWREANRERHRNLCKAWREANKELQEMLFKEWFKANREKVLSSDCYIKRRLQVDSKTCTPELIDLKREQLEIKRLVKQLNQAIKEASHGTQ